QRWPGKSCARNTGRIGRTGAAVVLVLALCASAATAATNHGAKRASGPTSTAGLSAHVTLNAPSGQASLAPSLSPASPIAGTNSTIGAGQLASARLVSASLSFTVPSFSCASGSDHEWLLPGIWILDGSGNLVSQVDFNFNCNSGVKLLEEVICLSGGSCEFGSINPNVGDKLEVTYVQTDTFSLGEVFDHTQHTAAQASGSALTSGNSVFEGDFGGDPFGVTAVPTFTKLAFTIATLNGFYIGDWGPSVLNLKDTSNVQIKSGAAATTSFTTKFVTNH